ncbi:hypothetical protein AX16_008833 [Volvariella volvacea WC 439]|nr:hypothetical protein AX16_008833 [Volvariella volvacea WC 439]
MDAYDDSQSQATQLLHNVLAKPPAPAWKPSRAHSTNANDQDKYTSSDSFGSSRRSIPRYNLHGLAETQTQNGEDYKMGDESQKENLKDTTLAGACRNESTPLYASKALNSKGHPSNPTRTTADISCNTLVSSPSESTAHQLVTSRHVSPLPDDDPDFRQGSVAREGSQQTARSRFRQFEVPLQELERGARALDTPEHPSPTTRSMFSYNGSSKFQSRRTPSPHGNILVDATPDQSMISESQSQSQTSFLPPRQSTPPFRPESPEPLSPVPRQPEFSLEDTQTQDLDALSDSSDPSSSFFEPSKADAVPDDLEPTQPTTEPDLDENDKDTTAPHKTITTAPSSGRRGLLSLVSADKRYRYQHLITEESIPFFPVETQPIAFDSVQQRMPTPPRNATIVGDETQPSHYNVKTAPPIPSKPPPPTAQFPPRNATPQPTQQVHRAREGTEEPPDVVPDSQPFSTRAPAQPRTDSSAATSLKKVLPDPRSPRVTEPDHDDHTEDDEVDDMPLADLIRNGKIGARGSAHGPASRVISRAQTESDTPRARPTRAVATEQRVLLKRSAQGRAWVNGEVPSSLPEQDSNKKGRQKTLTTRVKQEASSSTMIGTRCGSRSADRRSANKKPIAICKRKQIEKEGGCESELTSDDELCIPSREDTYALEHNGNNPASAQKSRKRKRITRSPQTRSASKVSMATTVGRNTPGGRQTKRFRSTTSLATRASPALEPTRVFALWRADSHYYPGVVHSIQGPSSYDIRFDDGATAIVKIDHLRLGELREGDDVLVAQTDHSSKVTSVSGEGENQIITVSLDDEPVTVPLVSIKVASKTIMHAWKDRILTPDLITPVMVKQTLTPSKELSTTFPPTRSSRKILAGVGLVVTLGAGNEDREELLAGIKSGGGIVIDEWSSVINMKGKYSRKQTQWVIEKSEVKWTGKDTIQRVFLLADEASFKPKFLTALALGIPCLSTEWLEDAIQEGEQPAWSKYLLDQGFSSQLQACITQQVDAKWGASPHDVKHIMDNLVPAKLFKDKDILCLGDDMFPQVKRNGAVGSTQEATNAILGIIVCMGAHRVKAVKTLQQTQHEVETYDYLIIRERDHYTPNLSELGPTVVDWQWVKDCLIASRLLPPPTWLE